MKPSDLDLPPKFASWRPYQEKAILEAVCSDSRFVMLNAPTGVGKSAVYMAIAYLRGGRTLIDTSTKALEAQLMGDFSSMGLVEIQGQNNYPCLYFSKDEPWRRRLPGCDEGPCHAGIECDFKASGCHYYDAVRHAYKSDLVVTNYRYSMTAARYMEPGTLGKFNTLILDEAHDAASQLADFVKISIARKEVRSLLGLDLPNSVSIDEWVDWAAHDAIPVAKERLEMAKTHVSLYQHGITVVRRLRELEARLADLAGARAWRRTDSPNPTAWMPGTSTDWVVEEDRESITFSPVWASGYADDFLFQHIPKVILVSATVTPQDARYLGIPKPDLTYFEFPSPFRPSIRPILVVPGAAVSRNMSQGEKRVWVSRIDQIIEYEGNVKGIVHSVSYEWAKAIVAQSRFADRMVIHDRNNLRATVDRFKAMSAPAVLVSPAVGTGYDFPMDTCRFQIIAKIPFVDHRSLLMQARHKVDKKYLDYVALVALIQMAGRGVRSANDFCRTWIVDDNWSRWFYPRNKGLVPRWFKQAIRRIASVHEAGRAA